MIRLSEWFQSNTRRPLAIAAVLVLALWITVAVKSYLEIEQTQRNGFRQLLDVMTLAMSQKNRVLVESILHTARTQAHAQFVAICDGEKAVLSSNPVNNDCRGEGKFWTRVLMEPIPGFANHRLAMVFPRVAATEEQLLIICVGLSLLVPTLAILRGIQVKFALEVVGPLKCGILGDDPLNIVEFEELRRAHHEAQDARTKVAVAEAVLSITRQVSHDIRSPLSALNMVVSTIDDIPERKRVLLKNASQRINDIAIELLKQSKGRDHTAHQSTPSAGPVSDDGAVMPIETVMLTSLLDSLVSEKRIQFRDKEHLDIHADLSRGYGLFAAIDRIELGRVISNLLNNSIEAMDAHGAVTVSLRSYAKECTIIISDTGKGIPRDVLSRLGELGISHGKENTESGSGLGVYHAKATIEKAGGRFQIQSKVGEGTMITMSLPRSPPPNWFAEMLSIPSGASETIIVTVADDLAIHELWKERFRLLSIESRDGTIEHLMFTTLDEFKRWYQSSSDSKNTLTLIDQEFLSQQGSGIETIERLNLGGRAILVTSKFEEEDLQNRIVAAQAKLLPKELAHIVPIHAALAL